MRSRPDIPPDAAAVAQDVFSIWNSGDQARALATLEPRADNNEPWALTMAAFLYMQQGVPSFGRALTTCRRATELGYPWMNGQLANSIFGNAPSVPELIEPMIDLLTITVPFGYPNLELGSHGWNMISNNRAQDAVMLWSTPTMVPLSDKAWESILERSRRSISEISHSALQVEAGRSNFDSLVQSTVDAINREMSSVETTARQAKLLVSDINASAINKLFAEEAAEHQTHAESAWRWGLRVLVLAAAFAVSPLAIHYAGFGPDYSSPSLLTVHLGASAASGAVAGVLLTRARSRDVARQRARDLATAIGTMISYSNQISDEGERQRFMLTMGQVVLQAHLQRGPESGPGPDAFSGLAGLLNAIRQPSGSSGGP